MVASAGTVLAGRQDVATAAYQLEGPLSFHVIFFCGQKPRERVRR